MITRPTVVTAAVAAAAALAATGITYASASAYEPAQLAPVVQQAAAPASAPMGGESGKDSEGRGNEGRGNEGRGNEGRGNEGRGFEGRIQINERSFSAHPDGCITVVSGLGSKSFNIRNDSRRTVEFFRGATCDNGAPVATVGPHSEANGIKVHHTKGVRVKDGVVGSFRVIHHFGEFGEFGGNGGHGGR
ncbi:hypothetical protein ACFYQA_22805 [Streptomyces sp. NPDC005774]|uniref:hypothetical protein n=1 Tax=Streptomyces sp. NPDC005774 TaxID=3364728 RepID=UPI0036C02699